MDSTVPRFEECRKRVRAVFAGATVADSTGTLLVWEKPWYPTYFFPAGSVRLDLFAGGTPMEEAPPGLEMESMAIEVGDRSAPASVRHVTAARDDALTDHFAFRWAAMDAWFEEDEEVFVHARDPHTRIDALRSTRHVVVEADGEVVADSNRPTILFETGLPPRWYLPREDIDMDRLEATTTRTGCPYKGFARYWSVRTSSDLHRDVAWSYEEPFRESSPIEDLIAFYDERLTITVDGTPTRADS